MTQPTDEPPTDKEPEGDPALLARLEKASNKAVTDASKVVSKFSPEDEATEKRRTKAASHKTIARIKRAFYWFSLVLFCVLITTCVVSYLYLIWMWLGTILYGREVHDAAALKSFIDSVLWSLLIIFATLFFEGVFKDKD